MSEVTGKLTVNEPLCVATTGFKPGLKSKIRINCSDHNYTVFELPCSLLGEGRGGGSALSVSEAISIKFIGLNSFSRFCLGESRGISHFNLMFC